MKLQGDTETRECKWCGNEFVTRVDDSDEFCTVTCADDCRAESPDRWT